VKSTPDVGRVRTARRALGHCPSRNTPLTIRPVPIRTHRFVDVCFVRRPIYLAVKTEVLVIEAALEQRVENDFYVSDLFDVFLAVQERSKFNKTVWQNPLSNFEFPTPYAFLLYAIAGDLDDLSCKAVQKATSQSVPLQADAPGEVAQALAMAWSFCVWSIADSEHQVAPGSAITLFRTTWSSC
jgi:hypothetical protein